MPPPRLGFRAGGALGPLRKCSLRPHKSSFSTCQPAVPPNRRSRFAPKLGTSQVQFVRGARFQTTQAADFPAGTTSLPLGARDSTAKLKAALLDLQKQSRTYVNISRLQLVLRGLEQGTGEETIRVALLGVTDQTNTFKKVRELARLLLADPLKEEEEWERIVVATQDDTKPLLLRMGGENRNEDANHGFGSKLVQELNLSSPNFNNHRLEILVLGSDVLGELTVNDDPASTILVPTVEIPTSNSGRYTPVTTPVHKALLLGDGILGAASLANVSAEFDSHIILSAVDLPSYTNDTQNLPLRTTDIALAHTALETFRKSVDNAMSYEHDWFKSGLPEILGWLKEGTADSPGTMKSPVRHLIGSVLTDTEQKIQEEESLQLANRLKFKVISSDVISLRNDLELWAEQAHTELRDGLDVAFWGSRWRKLGWWKLFWRVDDVSMIASDILNQRFLIGTEKGIIYLSGKIEQAGIFKSFPMATPKNWAYKTIPNPTSAHTLGSLPGPLLLSDLRDKPNDVLTFQPNKQAQWPLQISETRSALLLASVPALQALAQKLVLQTLTTSGLASACAILVQISVSSASFYEAGAIAALGVVWSLRRMQNKWETARKFWEGEVREEGRRSVRTVEGKVGEILADRADDAPEGSEELQKAREAVAQARLALDAMVAQTGK